MAVIVAPNLSGSAAEPTVMGFVTAAAIVISIIAIAVIDSGPVTPIAEFPLRGFGPLLKPCKIHLAGISHWNRYHFPDALLHLLVRTGGRNRLIRLYSDKDLPVGRHLVVPIIDGDAEGVSKHFAFAWVANAADLIKSDGFH